MATYQITIDLPQEIRGLPDDIEVEQEVKRYLAVKYYQEEALTIGKAADLAGMNRMEFELFLARNQIPISLLNYDDIQADLANMKRLNLFYSIFPCSPGMVLITVVIICMVMFIIAELRILNLGKN
jgi:predicted HTH domain antitoxin